MQPIPVQSYVKSIGYITFAYLAIFAIETLWTGDSEFFIYTLALALIMYFFFKYQPRIRMTYFLPQRVLVGISILGFLGIGGGVISVSGRRLLDISIIPGLFKYQDVMHIFFMFVMVLVSYTFLKPYLLSQRMMDTRLGRTMFYIMMILLVTGMGAVLEVLEFVAAYFFDAQVGGYLTNALDLLYNMLGAAIATLFLPVHSAHDPITKEDWLEHRDELRKSSGET